MKKSKILDERLASWEEHKRAYANILQELHV